MEPRESVELTDPRALRGYAHPIRMKLVGLLRREGELTASQAARMLGESSGTTSFHLRQLAKYGLVEETGGGRGRAKPWRATALFTQLPDVTTTPELADAATALRTMMAVRHHEQYLTWIARAATEPEQWQAAASGSDYMLYLTADELAELRDRIDALLHSYSPRVGDPAARPEGSRLVTYLNIAFPAAGP